MKRLVPLIALIVACSESTTVTPSTPLDAGADVTTAPTYPTENLGFRIGSVIPNVTMRGRRPDGTFADVPMATFWRPEQKSKSLVVIVAGWAQNGLTDEATRNLVSPPIADVLVVAVLSDGAGPSTDDAAANAFAASTGAAFVLLDPRHEALGALFDGAASPFTAMLDARTMEIVYAATGAVTANDVVRVRDDLH